MDQLLDLSRGLTDAQFDQAFDIGHQTLRATFVHMIFNVEFWTALMTDDFSRRQRDQHLFIARALLPAIGCAVAGGLAGLVTGRRHHYGRAQPSLSRNGARTRCPYS